MLNYCGTRNREGTPFRVIEVLRGEKKKQLKRWVKKIFITDAEVKEGDVHHLCIYLKQKR